MLNNSKTPKNISNASKYRLINKNFKNILIIAKNDIKVVKNVVVDFSKFLKGTLEK
jgi:hypothetical protein